jgi:hypothetical protein
LQEASKPYIKRLVFPLDSLFEFHGLLILKIPYCQRKIRCISAIIGLQFKWVKSKSKVLITVSGTYLLYVCLVNYVEFIVSL